MEMEYGVIYIFNNSNCLNDKLNMKCLKYSNSKKSLINYLTLLKINIFI